MKLLEEVLFYAVCCLTGLCIAVLTHGCASEPPSAAELAEEHADERPVVDVEADQFIAPSDVGVSAEALTVGFTTINSDNGGGIWRAPGDQLNGLRCWVMGKCTKPSCVNNEFSCGNALIKGVVKTWCFKANPNGNLPGWYYNARFCNTARCSVYLGRPDESGTRVGEFVYGTDPNYVWRSGSNTGDGYNYASCKLTDANAGRVRLTLSTVPL